MWLIVAIEEWTKRKATKRSCEKIVKDINRATRKRFSSEKSNRIVLDALRGVDIQTLPGSGLVAQISHSGFTV